MKKLAPICLFVYNRLNETKRTVEALQKNILANESDLIVFSDGTRLDQSDEKVLEVRNYIRTISGFKSIKIVESITNNGLANSIIEGVTRVIKQHGKIIVLEDDLLTTPNFLNFMNQALDFYMESSEIQSVNGYSLKIQNHKDVYFHRRAFPWGWGTWEDRWSQDLFDKDEILKKITDDKNILTDFDKVCGNDISSMLKDSISGVNNSWYVRWAFSHFLNEKFSVYPKLSKITNIGFNDEATHCMGINTYVSELDNINEREFSFIKFRELEEDINNKFLRYFKKEYKFLFRMRLLRYSKGRNQVFKELKDRFVKKFNK